MIVTVASYKGGVGKTTTAVHLAAFLQTKAPTLLLDSDETRNATTWGEDGPGFPFRVVNSVAEAQAWAGEFRHTVIDTGQRPSDTDVRALTEACDLLVIPAAPSSLDTKGLVQTLRALAAVGATNYRVLIVKDPPPPETEGQQLRAVLKSEGVPVFAASIPRLKAFEHAAATGRTVADIHTAPGRRAWDAFTATGKEMLRYGRK